MVAEVEWVVNGENEKWSFRGNDDALLKLLDDRLTKHPEGAVQGKVSVGGWGTAWPSSHYLSNGREQLKYTPSLRFANLYDHNNPISQKDFLPTGTDGVGAGDKPNRALSLLKLLDQRQAAYGGTAKYRGTDVHVVRSHFPERKPPAHAISMIDSTRGFLIVRAVYESPEYTTTEVVTEAKRCVNGSWFPLRAVTCISEGQPVRVLAREYAVVDINVDVPSNDKFRVDLPARTGIVDLRDHHTTFVNEAPISVGLDDISRLFDRGKQAAMDRRAMDAGTNKTGTSTWWWLLAGGAFAAVCAIALWRRRSAHSASE